MSECMDDTVTCRLNWLYERGIPVTPLPEKSGLLVIVTFNDLPLLSETDNRTAADKITSVTQILMNVYDSCSVQYATIEQRRSADLVLGL